jgi:hypothetical protein
MHDRQVRQEHGIVGGHAGAGGALICQARIDRRTTGGTASPTPSFVW